MAADELTKALLLEEVAAPRAIAEALFASVNGGVPLLQALVDAGAISPELLARYLARSEAPYLRHVAPLPELVARLPRGLCTRLLAVPVRHDAITGTVDVAVVDPADPHPLNEIAFHLGMPVRAVRASLAGLEEGIRRLRMPPISVPPPEPALARAIPLARDIPPRRGGLVIDPDSAPPPPERPARIRTPPWGTPLHLIAEQLQKQKPTEQPPSGYGSEIPIPLTRKTYNPPPLAQAQMLRGGTQRPPAFTKEPGLGEGYSINPPDFRDIVEKRTADEGTLGAFIPGPPPVPDWGSTSRRAQRPSDAPARGAVRPSDVPKRKDAAYAAYAPQLPFPEMGGILAALRNAGSRDEILELVLTAARMVALKVGLFVVKKGGYLGWIATPEFADRASMQSILIPLESNSVFDRAVREDLYLGPIRRDDAHAPLLRVMRNPSRDVAVVPIRVSGKTAVIIVADELGDTMIGTRRLEELARAAGDAFARIVRTRR